MPRFQLTSIFVSLVLLRVVVGFHFFKEGTTKLQSGDFSSRFFLAEAKGPYSDFFHRFLDDPYGVVRLCLKTENPLVATSEELQSPEISPDFTFAIWNDFRDRIHDYYQFGSEDHLQNIRKRLEDFRKKINEFAHDSNRVETIKQSQVEDLATFTEVEMQPRRADEILKEHKQLLEEFLEEQRSELIVHFGSSDRLIGFDRDGDTRQATAQHVESLREQVESIKGDRKRKLQNWLREVELIWDSLEKQLNDLAVDSQKDKPPLALHRPFSQPYSWQRTIDKAIPWFDTIVGALLILGLFTRFASLAAAIFLVSVIATQPPWIPGTTPTYLYFVELAACIVIFTTAAGRIGGLDFFIQGSGDRASEG